jgi:hypothetical protein
MLNIFILSRRLARGEAAICQSGWQSGGTVRRRWNVIPISV